ncbi:hypothetical protein IYQ92_03180 [Streptococcus sp. HF-1907]|uniref:hypothetical protein n=1 Tax=Streptococcus sp. HF-1907 TaxID=2785793 RepID=UPI0018A03CDA|nr:hypothetical protein [Streptococcus sp. HF-1907]MBF7094269.1 hypothetical protein [Streptococcus sp. HF-1907]
MIKVTATCDDFKAEARYNDDTQLETIKTKILSQMNNGHTVILGEDRGILLNPKVIKVVQFEIDK